MSLAAVLTAIQDGTYAPAIRHVRAVFAAHGEAAYKAAKERLPQLTFAGTFAPTRAKHHLQRPTGLVHADIDHLAGVEATKQRLIDDPCVVYCFTSPRGDGLKYGVRVAPVASDEDYKHAWGILAAAHLTAYNVVWDPSGKDICRLCFVSWDPACYANPEALIYDVPPPAPRGTPAFYVPPARQRRPSNRHAQQAKRAVQRAVQLIRDSVPGQKHAARCRAAYLLGGYIGGGLLTMGEAEAALALAVEESSANPRRAMKDVTDALTAGQAAPITIDDLEAAYQAWRQRRLAPAAKRTLSVGQASRRQLDPATKYRTIATEEVQS